MKYAPVGFSAAIMILFAASSGLAQERDHPSQNEIWQGERDQAYGERGNGSRRGLRDSNAARSGGIEGVQGGERQFARFRFTRGNARFDIRCPANEQMRDCLQAGSQFLTQLARMPVESGAEKGSLSEPNASGTKQ